MFAQLYHAHHSLHPEDIPFWLELASRCVDPILELGCGTGRVMLPLAQAGHQVYGLDNDADMLAFLRTAIPKELQSLVQVEQADFTSFKMGKKFGLAMMPCNTYSTLSRGERRSTLACIQKHLIPSGCFAVSMPNPNLLFQLPAVAEPEVEDNFVHPLNGTQVQVSSDWVRTDLHFVVHWYYDQLLTDGEIKRESIEVKHNLTPAKEYIDEFYRAGFNYLIKLGDYQQSRYSRRSQHFIILAWLERPAIYQEFL